MWELVSTGDECPGGSAVFHFTFLVGPNSTGTLVASETPRPFGPRKRVQFSAAVSVVAVSATAIIRANRRLLSMAPILAKNPQDGVPFVTGTTGLGPTPISTRIARQLVISSTPTHATKYSVKRMTP